MLILRQPDARLSLAAIPVLLLSSLVHGQGAQSQAVTTMSVDVKVVTLPVTVRDKKGQIVRNLTKDDFVLQEDGRPQVIKYFTQDSNLPLTLGLLVDTSLSQRNVLDQERNASKVFLDQMLTDANDKAFLIHFDREVELLQDLTSSRDKLQAGLELLRTPQADSGGSSDSRSSPDSGNGQPHMHRGGGTLLYDAIFLASNELMKKQQGRKALIVLTDGDDRGSKESLQSAIEAAQRADTVVYSILFADKHEDSNGFGHQGGGGMGRHGGGWPGGGFPGGGGSGGGGRGGGRYPQEAHVDGKKILEQISKETGGRLYEASKKLAIDQIYDSIAEELRTQYDLGYMPDKGDGGGYHKISLAAKQKDLVVQTRDGYYADR